VLNSPWGVALAPSNFGDLSGALLIGNFGDGKINRFDQNSGDFLDSVNDSKGKPIATWAIKFGSGSTVGGATSATNELFFTAGTNACSASLRTTEIALA
jgi:uncharacterized protein (TIGR03118 family)